MEGMEQQIGMLVDNILSDYQRDGRIDQGNTVNQLDKGAIIEIVHKLQQMIFPGYFKNKKYRVYTVKNNLSMLLEDVLFHLSQQVEIVFSNIPEYSDYKRSELTELARSRCVAFLEKIPAVRQMIETDVQAAYDGDPAAYNTDEIIFSYPGLYAIMVNRLAHELH